MSKERLEEIKRRFNDYEWLIGQAELVQELEADNYNMDVELEKLYKQNKHYREVLEKLVNAPQDMLKGRYADYAEKVAREALEESE